MYKMTTGLRHIATEPATLKVEKLSGPMQQKKSPQARSKIKSVTGTGSDSDGSLDSSPSVTSSTDQGLTIKFNNNNGKDVVNQNKRITRRGSEWEILAGLKDGQRFDQTPEVYSGYLLKKRKWPLKGWHKRFFIVDKGGLVYGKSPSEIARGKVHGIIDIGLSVISSKAKRKRLDIDADEFIYHLKAKNYESFSNWVDQLKTHRLYRQHVLTYGSVSSSQNDMLPHINKPRPQGILSQHEAQVRKSQSPPPPRVSAWAIEYGAVIEQTSKDLNCVEQYLSRLVSILDQLEASTQIVDNENGASDGASPAVKKDKRKFGLRRKKSNTSSASWGGNKSFALLADHVPTAAATQPNSSPYKSSGASQDNFDSSPVSASSCTTSGVGLSVYTNGDLLSNSNPSLSNNGGGGGGLITRPVSLHSTPSSATALTRSKDNHNVGHYCETSPSSLAFNDFIIIARDVYRRLRTVSNIFSAKKDQLKLALQSDVSNKSNESNAAGGNSGGNADIINNSTNNNNSNNLQTLITMLQTRLARSIQQNNELKIRLDTIHSTSDISDVVDIAECVINPRSLSCSNSFVSATDLYFDAEEHVNHNTGDADNDDAASVPDTQGPLSDTSSEAGSISSEDDSVSSGNSECVVHEYDNAQNANCATNITGRRMKLPSPRNNMEGLSLWNLLRKNIGKDLSQVSMPVALNEPLNMLQRLCEELEYSELLDKAAETEDPFERMVYVAAFAVSSYGSAYYRAGSKPFNPLLGETYECTREDRGFRFISEQVSHHPPVSVCYADSKNFLFWQDIRIKTKFWGKSMEFQPLGYVNVKLFRSAGEDDYRWNKVTTCLHNLFSDKRWADLYGELNITNVNRNITCKLTFVKASYWSAKKHEVYGAIFNENGEVVHKLFGKWNEALYCGTPPTARCVWRSGTMPEDYELYYGFTRFAMELNELEPGMEKLLPPTDTRYRPDQRLLEEGDLNGAEAKKQQLEQMQRDRRKKYEMQKTNYEPKWFRKVTADDADESWEYTNTYWHTRDNGFPSITFEQLW